MLNPSKRSRDELYAFLEHKELPLLDDGRFLAYKGVKENYRDCHSNKFDNEIGKINEMSRRDVDDNFLNACSYGFHVGSYEYARGFRPSNGHLMFVAVSPEDVVSV